MTIQIDDIDKKRILNLKNKKSIPNFRAGDTIKVNIKVIEGDRSRIQAFEGVCLAKKNSGINSSFTVRKISHGEGIERVFPIFSPIVDSIEVIRQGDVRRGKLYYLRDRSGKSARISDKDRGIEDYQYTYADETKNSKQTDNHKSEDNDKASDIKSEKIIKTATTDSTNEEPEKIEENKNDSNKVLDENKKNLSSKETDEQGK